MQKTWLSWTWTWDLNNKQVFIEESKSRLQYNGGAQPESYTLDQEAYKEPKIVPICNILWR